MKEATDSANRAMIFGIIGLVVGVLGLAVAAAALTRRSKGGVVPAADKEAAGTLGG